MEGFALGKSKWLSQVLNVIDVLPPYGPTRSVPVPSPANFVLLSLIVGVFAAVLRARRAGKLNVLTALSYE